MAERMIRTQVYLPPKVHVELKRRAKKHGLTLALQIREALEDYLERARQEEQKARAFDPTGLFAIIDSLQGGGPPDLAEHHDKYLYSDPHGEKNRLKQKGRDPAALKTIPIVRERRGNYGTKKRGARKRPGGRK